MEFFMFENLGFKSLAASEERAAKLRKNNTLLGVSTGLRNK